MQIVINAGGSGTRLWPISTEVLPKQFCSLVEEKSMLRVTYERFVSQYTVDNLWISVNQKHLDLVKLQIPEIPVDHILIEPERRDTFPAVAAHSAVVAGLTSVDENIIFVPADAHIEDDESIVNLMNSIAKIDTALDNHEFKVGVIGIKPNFPSTQFGYVEFDDSLKGQVFSEVCKVDSFKEKPNFELATDFYNAGNYLWNFGAFAFKYSVLKNILEVISPENVAPLEAIREAKQIDLENFRQLKKDAFDIVVLEKIGGLGVIGVEVYVWDDIGNYEALKKYMDEAETVKEASYNVVQIAGNGNRYRLIDTKKKVAFVGVTDLVLVENEEGLLIINPEKSSEVKQIAQYFQDYDGGKHL